jgi:UDP-N-acetyl-D-glucosamine dehydrogenase
MASEINGSMPNYVVQKIADALNEDTKPVKGSKILVLGVAYKKNVGDVRESPALDIMELLARRGAQVEYHDPHVTVIDDHGIDAKSVALTDSRLRQTDCVVIVTDHDAFNMNAISRKAKLIVDTRNSTKKVRGAKARIVKL